MKKIASFLISVLFAVNIPAQPWLDHGKLTINPVSPHYIEYEDGTPFFWLGDTGWELLHRLDRKEADAYLENRRSIGFNVIQTVILSEFYKGSPVNIYGDSLFHSEDPSRPFVTPGSDPANEAEYDYWDHTDFILTVAASKGLYVALFPTWGEWVIPREGKAMFTTRKEAYEYGWFIADRFRRYKNIIWMLGGDRHPDEREGGSDLWRAMAEGIADATNGKKDFDGKADYSTTFMSHHSFNSSSNWFHKDPWIDFHTWGSYHADFYIPRSWQIAAADFGLPDPKPTINSEPNYEGHNVNYEIEDNGFFTAVDMRIAAYWSVFAGCAGFTYGAHQIWQFTDARRPPYNKLTKGTWQEALNLPGARQVALLKKLMESFPFRGLTPDQSIITNGQGSGAEHVCAIRGEKHALVYIPSGADITVQLGILKGNNVKCQWFDPRNGEFTPVGEFPNSGQHKFSVPGISRELSWLRSGRGCDWVLVMKSL